MQLPSKFQPHILKVGGVIYFRCQLLPYLGTGAENKRSCVPKAGLSVQSCPGCNRMFGKHISFSAGKPLSRCEFQHVRGWRQQVSLAMSLVGGTGTARHTVLLLTALARNKAGRALPRGPNKCSILLASYSVSRLHATYFLSE